MTPIAKSAAAGVLLAAATQAHAGESRVPVAPTNEPFIASYLVKAKDGMSFEEFRAYQLDTHVPLATALPGLQAYRLYFFPPNGDQSQAFHAMAQVTFESVEAHDAALASPEGQRALGDLPNFLQTDAMMVLTAGTGDVIAGSAVE